MPAFNDATRLIAGLAVLSILLGTLAWLVRRLLLERSRLRATIAAKLVESDRLEHARRASEGFYLSLVESLPQCILRKDVDGHFTFVNGRFCQELDCTSVDVVGKTDRDFYPLELAEKYRRDDIQVMNSGRICEDVEKHVTPDQQVRYVHVIKTPLTDETGRVVGLQGIFWDVTEQKQATEALALSEERFALAMRGANDGLWDWDIRTNDVYYSPRFSDLLGFSEGQFHPDIEAFRRLVHPDDREEVLRATRSHLRDRGPFSVECRLTTAWGEERWFLVRGQAVWDGAGRATRMVGSISDINARREAEELLRTQNHLLQEMAESVRKALGEREQAQSRMVETAKMAGLGQLVAGVAHEINNPLAFVGNNVAVLHRDFGELRELLTRYRKLEPAIAATEPGQAVEIAEFRDSIDLDYTLQNLDGLMDRTRDGLRRIRDIVKDLRIFARLDESEQNEVDLNAGIDSTTNIILGYAKRKHVTVIPELGELPPVICFAAKINQVITNLLVNAIDASPENGRVYVRTRADADNLCVEVADEGHGIDPAVRDRIFDPFFTTKPVGEGTGLGLSISYGIIQDHGGRIEVESEPGKGSTFRFHLPLRPSPRPRPEPALAGVVA